jgi:hypothetical protein
MLETLTGSEWEWIKHLISAFNAGDIGKFDSLANNFESEVSAVVPGEPKLIPSQSSTLPSISSDKRSALWH